MKAGACQKPGVGYNSFTERIISEGTYTKDVNSYYSNKTTEQSGGEKG